MKVKMLLKHLHKAKKILLINLIIVVEAVVAFKYELLHCFSIAVDKPLQLFTVISVWQGIIIKFESSDC
jgi:hypothetical protein